MHELMVQPNHHLNAHLPLSIIVHQVSKSANYCYTDKRNNVSIMLLCEVALGKQNCLLDADNYLHDHMPKVHISIVSACRVAREPSCFLFSLPACSVH